MCFSERDNEKQVVVVGGTTRRRGSIYSFTGPNRGFDSAVVMGQGLTSVEPSALDAQPTCMP